MSRVRFSSWATQKKRSLVRVNPSNLHGPLILLSGECLFPKTYNVRNIPYRNRHFLLTVPRIFHFDFEVFTILLVASMNLLTLIMLNQQVGGLCGPIQVRSGWPTSSVAHTSFNVAWPGPWPPYIKKSRDLLTPGIKELCDAIPINSSKGPT